MFFYIQPLSGLFESIPPQHHFKDEHTMTLLSFSLLSRPVSHAVDETVLNEANQQAYHLM